MSENRKCVNCRHNIRKEKPSGNIECVCEITNSHIGYVKCFEGWCRHWAKQKDGKEAKFVFVDDFHTVELTEETIKSLEELRQKIYDKLGISQDYFTSHHIGTYLARDMQLPAIIKKNEKVWQENLEMLQDGILGDVNSPKTLLRYWKLQAEAHYPCAVENVRYFEDVVRKENENAQNKG